MLVRKQSFVTSVVRMSGWRLCFCPWTQRSDVFLQNVRRSLGKEGRHLKCISSSPTPPSSRTESTVTWRQKTEVSPAAGGWPSDLWVSWLLGNKAPLQHSCQGAAGLEIQSGIWKALKDPWCMHWDDMRCLAFPNTFRRLPSYLFPYHIYSETQT